MAKIKVAKPVVEIDGDEMTRIIWQWIREQLILPYLGHRTEIFRPFRRESRCHQRQGDDRQRQRHQGAWRRRGSVRRSRPTRHASRSSISSRCGNRPTARSATILGGVVFREPIVIKNVPRLVPGWTDPIVVGRHAFGDQYRATDFLVPGPGKLRMIWEGADGQKIEKEVFDYPAAGVAMGMYNLDESIIDFARASMNYALNRGWPLYLSTKNTILKAYDGRFKDLFQQTFDAEFADKFKAANIVYEHRLIDDMVASALKWSGKFVWACKNYDGDVQSDTVAQGFGSLGLMTSVLLSPDGKTVEAEAAHGTVTRHYRMHQQGKANLHQPDRVDLRVDAGASVPRPVRRHARGDEVRRDAGARLHRDGGAGQHDQGSRDPDRPAPALDDDRAILPEGRRKS